MKKLNICILGCGAVARLHSRVAKTLRSQVNLLYASRDREKARQYNRKFKGLGAFGSYEEACASPNVDALFDCTPHALHLEHVRLAAKHGKPILIEKPVTRTLEELAEMMQVAEAAGVTCMVAENYLFKPLVRKIQHYLETDCIGAPLFIEINRTNRSRVRGWRTDAEMMGGGALLEGGVHWVNLLCSLGGDVAGVLAAAPQRPYERVAPFEDSLEILVKFADGTIGKMLHSWNIANRIGGLGVSKIFGTKGNIHFESNGVFVLVLGRKKRFAMPGLPDLMGYRGMLAHFLACVRGEEKPRMSLEVARRDLRIVYAAYRSLKTGKFENPHDIEKSAAAGEKA